MSTPPKPDVLGPIPAHEVQDYLASGGMGAVHVAVDLALGRKVAAKVLHPPLREQPEVVERFIEEARLSASLDHPHILPIYAIGLDAEGGPMITMKLIEGGTLHDMMQKDRLQPRGVAVDELVDVLITICDALAVAHAAGVIHGDLKSQNVLLGPHGSVYLADWGNARPLGSPAPRDAQGRPLVLGTPAVMASEQARGLPVDARTDVFGVGALLYTLLSRKVPYGRGGLDSRIDAAAIGRFAPLREIAPRAPVALREIAERAMEVQPDDRYASIDELRAALVAFRRRRLPAPTLETRPGQVLIREGDESQEVYIIEHGEFVVTVGEGEHQRELNRCGPGEVLGEIGRFAMGKRTATVTAVTAGRVRRIEPRRIQDELDRISPWMRQIIESLAARLHAAASS